MFLKRPSPQRAHLPTAVCSRPEPHVMILRTVFPAAPLRREANTAAATQEMAFLRLDAMMKARCPGAGVEERP